MAVSPDLLPICAACVGIVAGRARLVRRALVHAAARNPDHLGGGGGASPGGCRRWASSPGDFQVHDSALHGLAHIDYSTILVALAAGVAAMLSFETRAASAVGVAISVTTIPASALFGVSLGLGEVSVSWGAAGVLGVNVGLLLLSGTRPWPCSDGCAHAAARAARSQARPSGDHLHDHRPVPRAVVEVDQDQLLPGAERQSPADHRDLLRGADQRRALVRVGVGVVIQPVVLVVALGWDERSSSARRSATPPGSNSIVVIAAVDPRTKAVTSPSATGPYGHDPLDVCGDVNDVGVPLRRVAQLPAVHGHALTLANEDRLSPESGDAASANRERLGADADSSPVNDAPHASLPRHPRPSPPGASARAIARRNSRSVATARSCGPSSCSRRSCWSFR